MSNVKGNENLYVRKTLKNGLRVVYEKIPHVRSISFGLWFGAGSRYEDKKNNGISHFIEHMLFKGTANRAAAQIAESIDNIGGQINAFTGKECTCFYTKTLDEHLDVAVDVLVDMLFNSKMAAKDINMERKVILEEINMEQDSPEDLVHDILTEGVWGDHALGMPILGTQNSLDNINEKTIRDYMRMYYIPQNCVIAVAGNFDEIYLMDTIGKYFGSWESGSDIPPDGSLVPYKKIEVLKKKETEQIHLCLGFNGIEQKSDLVHTLFAINNIFGGGMSSRLFQKIREQKGLVYSIYSYPSAYNGAGLFTIYAGMNPVNLEKVMELINKEVKTLKKKSLTEDELKKAKEQLKGNYILGLESTSGRMNSIGKSELLLNKIYTQTEILDKINAVDLEKVSVVLDKLFGKDEYALAAVGAIPDGFTV